MFLREVFDFPDVCFFFYAMDSYVDDEVSRPAVEFRFGGD